VVGPEVVGAVDADADASRMTTRDLEGREGKEGSVAGAGLIEVDGVLYGSVVVPGSVGGMTASRP